MPANKIYKIPETRLPFVNGEIAEIQFKGVPYLVSAIWGGDIAGGRLYFWNPLTGAQFMRVLPKGVPGAYMLKTAIDGRLYIGDGNGDLRRYDPATDQMETLATGLMHSITWGGCVTKDYVIWTASPGDAAIYDLQTNKVTKVFSPIDPNPTHSHYGHWAIQAPDGKALLLMDIPQAHLVVVDPKSGTAIDATPESSKNENSTQGVHFIDPTTLLVITNHDTQLLSYPELKLKERFELPKNCKPFGAKGCAIHGAWYTMLLEGDDRNLYRLLPTPKKWEKVAQTWMGEDVGYVGSFQNQYICGISTRGVAYCMDVKTSQTRSMQIDNFGQLEAHAMCVSEERNIVVGAPFINSSFWTLDLESGNGKDQGRGMPGAGQINQIIWDAGRHVALMSSYTAAAITEYDPSQPTDWPRNPRLVATAKSEQQMHPMDMVFDNRYLWLATSPNYGLLGGATSRIDPQTNEIKIWRNIVKDQTINALVLDKKRRRLYFSSEIYADQQAAPPTQTTAEIGVLNIDSAKVEARRRWTAGVPQIGVICMLPDGRVLIHERKNYFAWDSSTDKLESLGDFDEPLGDVEVAPNGTIYASMGDNTGILRVNKSLSFEKKWPGRAHFMQIVGNRLFYALGIEIHEVDLS